MTETTEKKTYFDHLCENEDPKMSSWFKTWQALVDLESLNQNAELHQASLSVLQVLIANSNMDPKIKIAFCYSFQHGHDSRSIDIALAYDEKALPPDEWLEQNEQSFDFIFRRSWGNLFGKKFDDMQALFFFGEDKGEKKYLFWGVNLSYHGNWKKSVRPELHKTVRTIDKRLWKACHS